MEYEGTVKMIKEELMPSENLTNDEISIIVETMGGIKFAYDYTKAALSAGKSVVTSNKELVAKKGTELLKIAHL